MSKQKKTKNNLNTPSDLRNSRNSQQGRNDDFGKQKKKFPSHLNNTLQIKPLKILTANTSEHQTNVSFQYT